MLVYLFVPPLTSFWATDIRTEVDGPLYTVYSIISSIVLYSFLTFQPLMLNFLDHHMYHYFLNDAFYNTNVDAQINIHKNIIENTDYLNYITRSQFIQKQ